MRLHANQNGFALPMVIMVIGFMTAGVLASFTRSGAEVQIVDSQRAEMDAFAVAQAGLDAYLARGRVDMATMTYSYPNGTATVTITQIRPAVLATDQALFLVQSTGQTIASGTRPRGRRVVGQLARRVGGTMQVLSSWTSLSGLNKAGASGTISGDDACTDKVLPGVAVPTGTLTGKDETIQGEPDVKEMGTQSEMASKITIDWLNIANASAPSVSPDYILCVPGSYGYDADWTPCTGWPNVSLFTSNPDFWPVIVVNGTVQLPTDGRGTLIVTGDLTFGGNDKWFGIIMVGGKIVDNGAGDIEGAVVTGLNVLKGMPVGESSKANGTKDYQYDSCDVASAAAGMAKLAHIPNAWVDNLSRW